MSAVLKKRYTAAADYLALVREWPLRPLRNERDHAEAVRMYARFAGRDDLSTGENDYIDALTHFIDAYEQRKFSPPARSAPRVLLADLMQMHGLNVTKLGQIIGSRGMASDILAGKRAISVNIAGKLGEHFAVAPHIFIRFD